MLPQWQTLLSKERERHRREMEAARLRKLQEEMELERKKREEEERKKREEEEKRRLQEEEEKRRQGSYQAALHFLVNFKLHSRHKIKWEPGMFLSGACQEYSRESLI